MPTGYTADVGDGKLVDFPAFAMRCARAFGALVELRDASMDAPVPDEFKPSQHHAVRLAEAEAKVAQLDRHSFSEAAEFSATEHAAAMRSWAESQAKQAATRARYEAMLAQVREWTPPTADHQGMKKFMEDQLVDSIKFDCDYDWSAPEKWDATAWLEDAKARAAKNVVYHRDEQAKDEARAKERTEWVRALRESLAPVAQPAE